MNAEMSEVISRLDSESRYILTELFGLDKHGEQESVDDVAKRLHSSIDHIREVRDDALRALREPEGLADPELH